jgi:hypothetical protein
MIRKSARIGAAIGAGVSIVLVTLTFVNPFHSADGAIEWLTFRLCPLFILAFANGMRSMTGVVILTIVGNAILYGAAFGVIAALVSYLRRHIV